MEHDVRGLANFVLERAAEIGRPATNVHVNKILYFLYVWYLLKEGKPLTGAKIEAWEYGPVFREVYLSFKNYGKSAILAPARAFDPISDSMVECRAELTGEQRGFLEPLVDKYLAYDAFDLVELTHKKNTPWDIVYNHTGRSNPGMRISDELIVEYYAQQPRQ